MGTLLAIKMRRERSGRARRSWRLPGSVEKVQSDSRFGGTNMAAVVAVATSVAAGESMTEMRMTGVWRKADKG